MPSRDDFEEFAGTGEEAWLDGDDPEADGRYCDESDDGYGCDDGGGGFKSDDEHIDAREKERDRLKLAMDEAFTKCWGEEDAYMTGSERWVWFRMGDAALMVSDKGKIRCPRKHFVSEGYAIPGSPYRSYPVPVDKYDPPVMMYVHDIVWRAFCGPIPDGYEVRHTMWVVREGHEKYPNGVNDIQLYRKIVGGVDNK